MVPDSESPTGNTGRSRYIVSLHDVASPGSPGRGCWWFDREEAEQERGGADVLPSRAGSKGATVDVTPRNAAPESSLAHTARNPVSDQLLWSRLSHRQTGVCTSATHYLARATHVIHRPRVVHRGHTHDGHTYLPLHINMNDSTSLPRLDRVPAAWGAALYIHTVPGPWDSRPAVQRSGAGVNCGGPGRGRPGSAA